MPKFYLMVMILLILMTNEGDSLRFAKGDEGDSLSLGIDDCKTTGKHVACPNNQLLTYQRLLLGPTTCPSFVVNIGSFVTRGNLESWIRQFCNGRNKCRIPHSDSGFEEACNFCSVKFSLEFSCTNDPGQSSSVRSNRPTELALKFNVTDQPSINFTEAGGTKKYIRSGAKAHEELIILAGSSFVAVVVIAFVLLMTIWFVRKKKIRSTGMDSDPDNRNIVNTTEEANVYDYPEFGYAYAITYDDGENGRERGEEL